MPLGVPTSAFFVVLLVRACARKIAFAIRSNRPSTIREQLMTRSITRLILGIIVSLALGSVARANSDIWKTATSGVWGLGTYWADNSTPGNGDQAQFDKAGTYAVWFSDPPLAIQDLFVS